MRIREFRRLLAMSFTMAVGLVASGCADKQEPVGRLSAGMGEIELSFPGVTVVELNWGMSRALDGLEGEPVVFLHLMDTAGNIVRTFDHSFPGEWQVGGEQSYTVPIYQSALAPPLNEGSYRLTAGLYDRAGNRWPLESAGAQVAKSEYELLTVMVVESGPGTPQFFFSSDWLAVEGGTDLQTLGRRWLTEDGVIRLGGVTMPGQLRLVLGIPEGGGALQAPVLDEGAVEQSVTVTTSCGDAAVQVSGSGSHPTELAIAVPDAGEGADVRPAECEITFAANYYLLARESEERRTVALEGLSWSQLE